MPKFLLEQPVITPCTLPMDGHSQEEQRNAWFEAMKETLSSELVKLRMGTEDECRIVELVGEGENAVLKTPFAEKRFFDSASNRFDLYEMARQGRLFVYPAGEKRPRQLQVGADGAFAMSSPLELEPRVAPKVPVEPTVPTKPWMNPLKWLAYWITLGWAFEEEKKRHELEKGSYKRMLKRYPGKRAEYERNMEQYRKDAAACESYNSMVNHFQENEAFRTDEACEQERKQWEQVVQEEKFRQEKVIQEENPQQEKVAQEENPQQEKAVQEEALQREKSVEEKDEQEVQSKIQVSQDVPNEDTILQALQEKITARQERVRDCAFLTGEALERVYPEERRRYEVELTDCELSVLALGTTMAWARKKPKKGKTGDESAREAYCEALQSMLVPEDKTGEIRIAREAVSGLESVLKQVSKGNKDALPALLVDTLRVNNGLIAQEERLTDRMAVLGKVSGVMLQILRSDPKLMRQAQSMGLTDTELCQAKGAAALAEIWENGLAAQKKLLENAADGMDSYDPAACVSQIDQMRQANRKLAEFRMELGKEPTTEAALRKMDKIFKPAAEKTVEKRSALELVNEWVGPVPSVQKQAAVPEGAQPVKKTEEEIRKNMQAKFRQKLARDKEAKLGQKPPVKKAKAGTQTEVPAENHTRQRSAF